MAACASRFPIPGTGTSWPPHEHAAMLEERYVCFDLPRIRRTEFKWVYNETQDPELITAVRDCDARAIPSGYHPNVRRGPVIALRFCGSLRASRKRIGITES